MKLQKKHIIVAGLGVISIAAAAAYWQYARLMNYCIGLKRIKPNVIKKDNFDVDFILNFKNQSDIKFSILYQEYLVYVGNKLVTSATNKEQQVIAPNSMNEIKVNVKFNPIQSGKNLVGAILQMGNIPIRVDVKMKVKLWMFTVNIPYTYNTNIKELMAPSTSSSSSVICKK